MSGVLFRGSYIEVREGESVLGALERSGVEIPPSRRGDHVEPCEVRVVARHSLSPTVVGVELKLLEEFAGRGGQVVELMREDGTARPYAIANVPARTGTLTLHVRRVAGGEMSGWLHEEELVGKRLRVRGPTGCCTYREEAAGRPILLVGTGMGLAALLGVLREALHRGHRRKITLVHAASSAEQLYLSRYLDCLAGGGDPLECHRIVTDEISAGCVRRAGELLGLIGEVIPDPSRHLSYICGRPPAVSHLRRAISAAGAPDESIFTEPFGPAARRASEQGG